MAIVTGSAVGLFISIVGIVVSNASGAGAGGFVVPCFFICFGYSLAQSVALWNVVVGMISVWRVGQSVFNREPSPEGDVPIIDFDSVAMFQPSLFIGIELGFIVMGVMPEGIKLIVFTAMLSALTYFTSKKAVGRYQAECKAKETSLIPQKSAETKADPESKPLVPRKVSEIASPSYVPMDKIALNVVSFILLTTIHLVLGSKKNASIVGIKMCSTQYWVGLVLYFAALVGMLSFTYWYISAQRRRKVEAGVKFLPSEFEWNSTLVINTFLLAVLSGFFSSSYGVGGGIILNMVLIYKGVNPNVVTMTTMLSIIFICISTTTVYFINRIVPLDPYALVLIALTIPMTLVSSLWLKPRLQKHSSLILFVLTAALGLSAALVSLFGFYKAYFIDHNTRLWSFGHVCS